MTDDDILARAIRNAALGRALAREPDDLIRDVAGRLGISTSQARRIAAVLLDNMTAPADDEPTIH